ncbi:hypothetical protein [Enterobacter mori]|uniref:hypothetical protein n=1 Tax=Enterobacter mori TaxID=539813 RepID=UPI003B83B2E2
MEIICKCQSELVQVIEEWHQKQVDGLNLVIEYEGADLDFGDGLVMKAGTDMAKGLRLGVIVALNYLGKLPTFKSGEHDDAECDDSEVGRDE